MIGQVDADPDFLPRTKVLSVILWLPQFVELIFQRLCFKFSFSFFENFGVDYVAFSQLAGDCPILFLHYAFDCCQVWLPMFNCKLIGCPLFIQYFQVDLTKRPSFSTLISTIEVIRTKSLKATVLADLSRFFNEGENVTMTQIILKIFSKLHSWFQLWIKTFISYICVFIVLFLKHEAEF